MERDPPKKELLGEQRWLRGQLLNARITSAPARKQYTIFKVPRIIRNSDEMAYTPRQVVVGFNTVEGINTEDLGWYKWRCVRYLLARHRDQRLADRLLDKCLDEMRELEGWLMRRYSYAAGRYITGPSIIMEGCFILHLILRQHQPPLILRQHQPPAEVELVVVGNDKQKDNSGEAESGSPAPMPAAPRSREEQLWCLEFDEGEETKEPLMDVPFLWTQVKYDLLMLENQFPFLIIQKLFDLLKTQDDKNVDLVELAMKFFQDLRPLKPISYPPGEIHHLLHLFHQSLLPQSLIVEAPATPTTLATFEWIPSATELNQAGVKFKRKEKANIFDISFTVKGGILEVPPFHISNDSNIIFRNLMAFEQCFPVPPFVTAYALFMNCLAHTPDDARLLHQSRIAENATDEQVAGFFDRLCSNIQYPGGTNYLLPVYVEVGRYYESKWHKWRANLVQEYFGTPWVAISVVAAIVLLVLTIMQTYYTAYPFYHPSKD